VYATPTHFRKLAETRLSRYWHVEWCVCGWSCWLGVTFTRTPDTSRDLKCLNSAQELSETKRHAFIMPDLWPLI